MARPAKTVATGDIIEEQAAIVDDGLIIMAHQGNDNIRVHPTQISAWQSIGWQVVQ